MAKWREERRKANGATHDLTQHDKKISTKSRCAKRAWRGAFWVKVIFTHQ